MVFRGEDQRTGGVVAVKLSRQEDEYRESIRNEIRCYTRTNGVNENGDKLVTTIVCILRERLMSVVDQFICARCCRTGSV